MKICLLFAGQGAQSVGMGKDLASSSTEIQSLFQRADEILGRNLSTISFEGPDEELTKTVNCQPALYVHGVACLQALKAAAGDFPVHSAAGLSLGEFTAHAAAGTFDFETGLRLVADRGRFMQEACEATSGAMAALIGAEENAIREIATDADIDIANLNSPGQIVISGDASKVALAVSLAKERGVRRATMLNVAGAYHSRLMQPAYLRLDEILESTQIGAPGFPVISNIDARPVNTPEEIRHALREQVTGTVRWTETIEYLVDHEKMDLFIEFGPGAVLAGLVQRTRKGTPVVSVSDAASVQQAAEALRKG